MLSVVFVSRCENAALSRTEKILDAYAMRIGDKTWYTEITQEGLDTVRKALRAKASRRTAVTCRIITRKGSELAWIVGNQKRFSRTGACATRTTGAIHNALKTRRHFMGYPIVSSLAYAAALGHDFGKANKFFQEKIKKEAKVADPFRHEFLSSLIANYLNVDSFQNAWNSGMQDALKLFPNSEFPLGLPSENFDSNLLVRWLIATHHRLPARDEKTSCKAHVAEADGTSNGSREKCIKQAGSISEENFSAFKEAVSKIPPLPEYSSISAFIWARLILMLGDHYASADQRITQAKANDLIANSKCRQELGCHLFGVAKAAIRAAREVLILPSRLPALYPSDRKEVERPAPLQGDYSWQNSLAAKASLIADDRESVNRGTFAVLCADTGTGKTRAAIRLASILCGDNMRISVLLGLRTLTLQSGDAYIRQFRIPEDSVSILIGSKEIRRLHSAANRNNDASEKEDDELEPFLAGGPDYQDILPKILEHQCRRIDDKRLVCAPVLISTIDYIIGAGSWSRSQYLLPMLRMLSSDIILDEIDSYDLNDYPAIARLCFLAGIFGRRMILSSATTMPEIYAPLFEAYQKGWQSYAALAGTKNEIDLILSADCVPTEWHIVKELGPAVATYSDFANKVAHALRKKTILRRGSVLALDANSYEKLPSAICSSLWKLHSMNCIESPSGKKVSAGLIRIAHTQEAMDLSLKLAGLYDRYRNLPAKTFVKVVLYHSAMPLAVRNHIERLLDSYLVRKKSKDPFLDSDFVKEVDSSDCEQGIFLVVATPVEEVGRDHDFDWAIIEPSSTRSIAQCAGRVKRHRREKGLEEGKTNIAVLSHPLMHFRNSRSSRLAYRYPGFESAETPFSEHNIAQIAQQTVLLPGASACLEKDTPEYLPKMERVQIAKTLSDKISKQLGYNFCLTSYHVDKYRFRAGAENKMIYADPIAMNWNETDDLGNSKVLNLQKNVKMLDVADEAKNGFWITPTWAACKEIAGQTATLVKVDLDESFYHKYLSLPIRANLLEHEVHFNPILGVARKKR
jgi:CRISPR-associated endonuclease/helicase Cas3